VEPTQRRMLALERRSALPQTITTQLNKREREVGALSAMRQMTLPLASCVFADVPSAHLHAARRFPETGTKHRGHLTGCTPTGSA